MNQKIIALYLLNAIPENLEYWFITNNYITTYCTKDFIRYRVNADQNEIQLIFIINDVVFGTVTKLEYPNIVIDSWFSDEFLQYCIPIKLNEIEMYRSVIIDWLFNCHSTRAKTAFELRQMQKYTADFDEMLFPQFTECVTCIDVEELGFNLKEFFMSLNEKFKAIYSEFKYFYPKSHYLREVRLTKIYILEKYILGYSFRLENEPYEHFFYNIHLESLLHQITPFRFDDKPKLTVDCILEKINRVGIENLTKEEQDFLNKQK